MFLLASHEDERDIWTQPAVLARSMVNQSGNVVAGGAPTIPRPNRFPPQEWIELADVSNE